MIVKSTSIRFLHYIALIIVVFQTLPFLNASPFKKYSIEYLTTNTGLPSDEINRIIQDSNGFIWIGTPQGLVKYDGYKLVLYSTGNSSDKGFISNQIIDIAEDQEHNLWLATDKGVGYFDITNETFKFYNESENSAIQLPSILANTIACDANGNIWVGWAGQGIDVIHPKKGNIKHLDSSTLNSGLQSDWITRIFVDNDNNIWIGSWEGGITYINQETNKHLSLTKLQYQNTGLPLISPFTFLQDNNNKLWVGLWGQGIIQIENADDSSIHILKHFDTNSDAGNNLAGDIIFDLSTDNNNNIWIATDYGLDYIQVKDNKYTINHFKESANKENTFNGITSIKCDESGIIWAGTIGRGVKKIDANRIQFETFKIPSINNKTSQAIHAFGKTPKGDLLVGSLSRGFGIYNIKKKKFTPFNLLDDFSFLDCEINTVRCFEWDKKGNLWLGTRYNGLIKVDIKNKRYLVMSKKTGNMNFSSREVNDIYTDKHGYIWIATENGLYKMVEFSEQFEGFNLLHYTHDPNIPTSLSSNSISSTYQDSQYNIWISTFDKGINKLISKSTLHFPLTFKRYQNSLGGKFHLPSDNINSIFEDFQSNLWLGTSDKGLLIWDDTNKIFKNIYNNNQAIYNILEDDNHTLWISSNKGLIKLFYKDSIQTIDHFSNDNGLQGNNFIKGAAYKNTDGKLFFGGYNGFNTFNPQNIIPDTFTPPIRITNIKINNKNIKPKLYTNKTLELDYEQNNFSIEFASLAYSNPANNQYAYKLNGIDKNWNYVNSNMRTSTYVNLKPGNYQFTIKGTNSMGLWNDEYTTLNLYVKTPPYLTWWAILAYCILIFIIAGVIIYMFNQRLKFKRELEIEYIEHTKSEKLNRFKQQLFTNISHEFLTPITILSSIIRSQIKTDRHNEKLILMQRNIDHLSKMVVQFLNFRKVETGTQTLNVSLNDIVHFTQSFCKNFKQLAHNENITFTHTLPKTELPVWFDHDKLESILQNLLSNAFKCTPKRGRIKLFLDVKKSNQTTTAIFTIIDTGKGIAKENLPHIFERFFSTRSDSSKFSGFGIGLSLTKSHINLHKGKIDVESELGKGTSFTVTIPVNKEAYNKTEIVANNTEETKELYTSEQVQLKASAILEQTEYLNNVSLHVLLVEDNDDFRSILKDQLKTFFKISEASDGIEALKIAKTKQIDIIISDVLMPKMDGYELCKEIKRCEITSLIPVILLTAKISEEDRAEGYKVGADSFITKPFAFETLVIRVQTLSKQRKQLVDKYTSEKKLTPNEVKLHDGDEAFLVQFKSILEANLTDSNFSIKTLCSEIGMSNSMLYRKTHHLLGTSPNDALRQFRLTRAKHLLNSKELTISEIAHKCGYSDLSYFGVCFKKQFGTSPSNYIKFVSNIHY